MTSEQATEIKQKMLTISQRAECATEFADVGFLATILSNGPWFNGMTQERALEIFHTEYA